MSLYQITVREPLLLADDFLQLDELELLSEIVMSSQKQTISMARIKALPVARQHNDLVDKVHELCELGYLKYIRSQGERLPERQWDIRP